ncbi:ATP-dependent DNA helicase chl1 [Nosema granulosis]|uniref:ATP-dependent DNA helicase CHL1 n=1 Tax=Nosema granulosis TaxID=83296 RepID=A0A9P6KZT0_9MICR|nr:ATP-dependent DNA helicase chl1 [Nosema granulosis]
MNIPKLYEIQKKFIQDCSAAIENGKIGVFSSPTGTGKTLSLLLSLKNFIPAVDEDDDFFIKNILGRTNRRQKIYYCSRTHSQLRQVVNEFKKLNISTNSIVLGSRKIYCINKDVSKQSSIDVINSKCRNLVQEDKCSYHVEHFKESGVFSIEDLLKDSMEHKYCPYYFTKEYFKKAEIVFLPYNLLFSQDGRQSLGINLDGAIIVVDEAHNIIETVTQMNSASIALEDIKRYISASKKYKIILKDSSKNFHTISIIINILSKLVLFLNNQKNEDVLEVSEFLLKSKLHNFNTLELTENLNRSGLIFKLENYEKKLNLKLQDISKFLNLLVASDTTSRVQCCSSFLKIFPLSPKIFFEPFKPVKSIIFAGGTMEPIDELKSVFDYREVVDYSYQASDRNFQAFIVDSLFNKTITIKQTTREDSEMFNNIKKMIIEMLEEDIGGGTVVFLPSKYYLQVFEKLFSGFEHASCFFEGINSFEEYVLNVRRKASILFAVIGGTFSEGVNFSDDLCRLLIIIGIPYPNIDTEINERIKLNGYEWYTQTAMKKVNQTIGRAIRHSEDYATILLVDSRFQNLRKYLSSWVVCCLQKENFETVKIKTKQFSQILNKK